MPTECRLSGNRETKRYWQIELKKAQEAICYYNLFVLIDFDNAKNTRNVVERNLSFEQANKFEFSTAIVATDDHMAYPEVRYVALGLVGARAHVLCFTPSKGGIRVISFCQANSREIKTYEQALTTD